MMRIIVQINDRRIHEIEVINSDQLRGGATRYEVTLDGTHEGDVWHYRQEGAIALGFRVFELLDDRELA